MPPKRVTLYLVRFPAALSLAAAMVMPGCGAAGLAQRRPLAARSTGRPLSTPVRQPVEGLLTGRRAMGDWRTDAPGVRRLITVRDLPPPFATPSVNNHPRLSPRPDGVLPRVPAGFRVSLFASGLHEPRKIITAPNGDLFVAETSPGRVLAFRQDPRSGRLERQSVFASGLYFPFGLAFYPPGPNPRYLYVADTTSILRYPYRAGDLRARRPWEIIGRGLPGYARLPGGGHMTRDIVFSADGQRMFVSVGSRTNDAERGIAAEARRADILEFTPEGGGGHVYASGLRNAVGLAIQPSTGILWASVNERDGLGDDLPPDYITRVKAGGFYGWPWYYIGGHPDPHHRGAHPELRSRVIVPDVLVQAHSASLNMTFYTGSQFPAAYRGDAFAAEHGSWNRTRRTGYKVILVPLHGGQPSGEYDDFMTGFVTPGGRVWGRPVGVAVAKDGSLMVTDDGSNSIWRVSYER